MDAEEPAERPRERREPPGPLAKLSPRERMAIVFVGVVIGIALIFIGVASMFG